MVTIELVFIEGRQVVDISDGLRQQSSRVFIDPIVEPKGHVFVAEILTKPHWNFVRDEEMGVSWVEGFAFVKEAFFVVGAAIRPVVFKDQYTGDVLVFPKRRRNQHELAVFIVEVITIEEMMISRIAGRSSQVDFQEV